MPPEQIHGHPEKASDIYALGVLLYQLCTGYLPFTRNLATMHLPLPNPIPASQLNPKLPRALDRVLLRALANNPADRHSTAATLWQEVYTAIGTDPRLYCLLPELGMTTRESFPLTLPTNQISARNSRITRPIKTATTDPIITNIIEPLPNDDGILPSALHRSGTLDSRHSRPQQQPPIREKRTSTGQFDPTRPTATPKPIPRTTRNLPASQAAGPPASAVTSMPGTGKQASRTLGSNTSKTAPIVNKGGTGPIRKVNPIKVNSGGPRPPQNPPTAPGNSTQPPKRQTRRRRRWFFILFVAALIVVILVLLGSLTFANPSDLTRLSGPPASTTITITPDSKTLTDTYTFVGLTTGTPNTDARQVTTRHS